jgi:hypothetical protein
MTTVKIPDREVKILREAYASMGEPEPDSPSTLYHNSAFGDWCRAVIRSAVSPDDVEASEPADVPEDVYLPLELSVTMEEIALMDNHGIETTSPRNAYRRNGKLAQQVRHMLKVFCEEVVDD